MRQAQKERVKWEKRKEKETAEEEVVGNKGMGAYSCCWQVLREKLESKSRAIESTVQRASLQKTLSYQSDAGGRGY